MKIAYYGTSTWWQTRRFWLGIQQWRQINYQMISGTCSGTGFRRDYIRRYRTFNITCYWSTYDAVCVFISFYRRGFSWLKQNNKCNARDQASDVVLRKSLCVKYIHHHIDNHSRDLQASNCARVSIKPGGATRNKRQLLELSENQR